MRSDISIKNYTELILPKLSESQKKIYDIISKHPNRINSLDLEKEIGKERHKFSGRITELVKMDLIKVDRMQKVGDSTFGVWRTKNNIDKDGQINIF
jgi:DNA-binding MarR family transcriptional regulator